MTRESRTESISLEIPSDLDAASAPAVHASLMAGLDMAEAGDAAIAVALGDEREDCAPLALQLLASARRSFPPGTLSIDARGKRALATLTNSKDS